MSSSPGAKTSNDAAARTRSCGLRERRSRSRSAASAGRRERRRHELHALGYRRVGEVSQPQVDEGARLLPPRRGGDRPPACRRGVDADHPDTRLRQSIGHAPGSHAELDDRPARFRPPRRRSRRPRRRFGSTRRRAPRSRRIRPGRGASAAALRRQAFLQARLSVWPSVRVGAAREYAQDPSETTCVPFPRGSSR